LIAHTIDLDSNPFVFAVTGCRSQSRKGIREKQFQFHFRALFRELLGDSCKLVEALFGPILDALDAFENIVAHRQFSCRSISVSVSITSVRTNLGLTSALSF
jgi:hypothetical protein